MATKKGHEIPTIDVNLVTLQVGEGDELILDTANQIQVEVQSETEEAVKLIVKGILRAQKPQTTTVTGNQITLTDNVFNPEMVKILQGGTIKYWGESGHTTKVDTDGGFGVASYEPPVAGSADKGEVFTLKAYSAIYDTAGIITGYERITYPNCQGVPIALNSEDGAFRAPEYTINSAPKQGEAPYKIDYVDELPTAN
jgi:plastocyanin